MHDWNHCAGGVPRWPVDDPAVVVACAVWAAEAGGVFNILAYELGGGEVRRAVVGVHGVDCAVGDKERVCSDEARAQWELQGDVFEDVLFAEGVEVPVDVIRQHYRGCVGQGHRDQSRSQLGAPLGVVIVHDICCMGEDVAGEVLQGVIVEGESD